MNIKIAVSRLNHWYDVSLGVKALHIVQRVVRGALKQEVSSLGKEWKIIEDLYEKLGDKEFELFVQSQIDGRKKTIEKRGFYPSLLVEEEATQHYVEQRPNIIELWNNPSIRYKDPLFSKLFPIECTLLAEYWGRYFKAGKDPGFQECVLYIANTSGTDLWVASRLSLKDIPEEMEDARKLLAQGRGMIAAKKWTSRIPRELARAEIESCISEGYKIMGKKIKAVEVDTGELMEEPLGKLLAPILMDYVGPQNGSFKMDVKS